ncbi:Rieske (2Fe-2S) protein [Rhodococcus sp. Q]|uniref:Rieske (2Fe-2S) protein n=1 Tax=Rhodococcus sp. Q TaxID=2502252 RepID=UPI0010F5F355|nr:Rieske (2Fe-2S) protein [Rhodococcus sp. Q]
MSSSGRELSRRAFVGGVCAAGCLAVAGCAGSSESEPKRSGPLQVPVGDVPVGGGVVLRADQVVVTQPEPGVFHAFSAVCTHDGCLVSSIDKGLIVCRCHGSAFSVDDGSVVRSPAQKPLPTRVVEQTGDTLTITT